MPTYVFDKKRGISVDKKTGLPMLNQAERAATPQAPRVMGDIEGYQSPIDGSWVDGRRARRYDLEKNGCVDANDIQPTQRKLKNERFAKKRGLSHLLD
jgi:nitrous oxide reductase accessory protein NosL